MRNDTWKYIVRHYKDNFNVDEDTLNLIADFDVLSLCVKGIGNRDIAKVLSISEEEVIRIIVSYYQFLGFPVTLEYNIYQLYKENLLHNVELMEICSIYDGLKERVEKYESS
jgi:hypothetical protein